MQVHLTGCMYFATKLLLWLYFACQSLQKSVCLPHHYSPVHCSLNIHINYINVDIITLKWDCTNNALTPLQGSCVSTVLRYSAHIRYLAQLEHASIKFRTWSQINAWYALRNTIQNNLSNKLWQAALYHDAV